jgi:hypothetical protein
LDALRLKHSPEENRKLRKERKGKRRELDFATIADLHSSKQRARQTPHPIQQEKTMTREAKLMSGIILLTVPTIQYGGYFLLTSLMDKNSGYMANALRQNFFRAGHAHAGVIVILSLVCQILGDAALLPAPLLWFVRVGVPVSAILISAGFFFSVLPPEATRPGGAVALIYTGAVVLACAVLALGVGLLRSV